MDEDKIAKLQDLAFDFEVSADWKWDSWETMLQRLQDYKAAHGDVSVPHQYPADQKLSNFCATQRKEYKKFQQQQPSYMTQERIDQLEAIGFKWGETRHSESWEAMYERLKEYKAAKGNARVPRTYKEDKSLGAWVRRQRREYKKQKSGSKGYITDDRIAKLNELGFDWDLSHGAAAARADASEPDEDEKIVSWETMLERLMEFQSVKGHCQVAETYGADRELGAWCKRQRQEYAKVKRGQGGDITEERIQQLDSLGFDWELPAKEGYGQDAGQDIVMESLGEYGYAKMLEETATGQQERV
jgi:hypothetical protein